MKNLIALFLVCILVGCNSNFDYDVIIKHGNIYDGTGNKSYQADIGIKGDTIAAIGDLSNSKGNVEVDASGLAVSPGFINMLSWANESLIQDGKSQSDIRQGVTLEVMGEGWSMGPLNDKMKKEMVEEEGDIKYDVKWTTLDEYLKYIVNKGVSCNVASFVGAGSVRIYVIGYEDRAPNKEELAKMKNLVKQAMEDGALGVGSALIYAPNFYAKTNELIELCKTASEYGGMYISHIRSEGNQLLQAADELIKISREANIPAEIYHIKAAGESNWYKLDSLINKINKARAEGLHITADMYTYTAGETGLDAAMPPWVQEGGFKQWKKNLQDPQIREKVIKEMKTPTNKWENFFLASGSTDNILLVGFKTDSLKYLTGKSLKQISDMRHKSPAETAIDLVIDDDSRVGTVYFLMSEENIKKKISVPWISFGSDEASLAPEGVFLKSNPHPRAYGNVARLLGKYVRDEKIIPLEEAVRRLSGLPAQNLKIKKRGLLKTGYFADVVVFDPAKVKDYATYAKPHQYSKGVVDVFVNGVEVLKDGNHMGKTPGQVVRGPGWRGYK